MRGCVRYLILWPTAACDLDCRYCYRRLRDDGVMSWPTAAAALELAATSAASAGLPFHVQLAGGEPTLVPDLVERVITEIRRRRWPATIGLQTNATRLTIGLARLLGEHRVRVGVSLDGPPAVQQQLRGRAADTFHGLALLRDARVPVTVTTVLTSASAATLGHLAMSLATFANVRGLGLDPLVPLGAATGRPELAATPDAIAGGVGDLHRSLRDLRRVRPVPLTWREQDRVRRALAQPIRAVGPAETAQSARSGVDYCHACRGESLAVAPDGALYPCSQAVGDPDLRVGAVRDVLGIDWARLRRAYAGQRLRGPCASCPLRGRCPGDCPSRLTSTPFAAGADAAMCVIHRTLADLEQT